MPSGGRRVAAGRAAVRKVERLTELDADVSICGYPPSRLEVLQLCRSALISWADMVLAPSVAGLFKWRQFEPEIILLAVGW